MYGHLLLLPASVVRSCLIYKLGKLTSPLSDFKRSFRRLPSGDSLNSELKPPFPMPLELQTAFPPPHAFGIPLQETPPPPLPRNSKMPPVVWYGYFLESPNTVAVFKNSEQSFKIFDSHSRDLYGMPDSFGRCTLVSIVGLENVASCLQMSCPQTGTVPFEMKGVHILMSGSETDMQHVQQDPNSDHISSGDENNAKSVHNKKQKCTSEISKRKEKQLIARRKYEKKRKANESPEAREKRLAGKRESNKKRRATGNPETRKKRLACQQEHYKKKCANETAECREKKASKHAYTSERKACK